MPAPAVLLVYKRSAYARYREHRPAAPISGSLRRVLKASHARHEDALERVGPILVGRGLRVFRSFRSDLGRIRDMDRRFSLVVTVGGDGTFLETSHRLARTPILGVNSDPRKSVARFSACAVDGLAEVLDRYLSGRLKPVPLARLRIRLNGRVHPFPALNDLLVTARCPAEASRYVLRVGNTVEEQMSSGLWISTPVGSTAANASAGGKVLPPTARRFQYVVREVYHLKTGRRRLLGGALLPGRRLTVVSQMRDGGIYVDGANLRLHFGLDDRLEADLSASDLKVIGLRKCC